MCTISTKVVIALIAIATLTMVSAVAFVATAEAYRCPDGAVTVIDGDTLWGIVETHCTGEPRAAVQDLRALNPHLGYYIHPGDEIALPGPELLNARPERGLSYGVFETVAIGMTVGTAMVFGVVLLSLFCGMGGIAAFLVWKGKAPIYRKTAVSITGAAVCIGGAVLLTWYVGWLRDVSYISWQMLTVGAVVVAFVSTPYLLDLRDDLRD